MRILVCINYGRALAGATTTGLATQAPAMISWACAHAGPGVAMPLTSVYFKCHELLSSHLGFLYLITYPHLHSHALAVLGCMAH